MNFNKFIYFLPLVLIIGTTSVNQSDQCNSCTQMKSQQDCLNYGGCKWNQAINTTIANCTKTEQTPVVVTSFCSTISQTKCSKTSGCAYFNQTCTFFSGCSAYQFTSLQECQSIQSNCVTDGITCIEATDCSAYPQTLCELTINVSGRSCKWDTTAQTCRDLLCTEANSAVNSDIQCDAFSAGCITTGIGCIIKPLPSCSTYAGTNITCPQMKGSDGYCLFNEGTTNCKAKQCTDAPISTSTDQACNTYQIGCVTTGKGCVTTLGLCDQYTVSNPVTDCKGYIGTDGICEGDQGSTVCRSRQCENGTGTTDKECHDYKKGCVTNGVGCATSKSTCNGYQGTITTCPKYIATDGNCKGSSDTIAACSLKDCLTDSQPSYTTDALCKSNIQSWCITTGRGCVRTLSSCTTYTTDCQNLIGSEGKCTAGTSGNCVPRTCNNAPITYATNQECSDHFTNCVTTGAGCITQTSCQNTVTQLTCSGTKEGSNPCNWNALCVVSTSCNSLTLLSICVSSFATIINGNSSYKQACIWDTNSNSCKNAACTDFTGTNYQTDAACDTVFPGCVTNGQGCVDPNTCSISFKGTKLECVVFKAYCTNTDSATSTDPCIPRTCADSGLTYTLDQDCQNYLSECLTNGNGCINNTQPCSGYTGTPEQCNKFYGYFNGKVKGAKCWNTSATSSSCTEKQCSHAQGVNTNQNCDSFLSGCFYDGGTSCLEQSAPCSSYKYSSDPNKCQLFKGVNGTQLCYQSANNQCKKRECTDNTTATTNKDCDTFLSGCKTKGTGCVSSTIPCSSYEGTVDQCKAFVGNSIQCTKLVKTQCTAKSCQIKTDALNNQACITYKSSCRLIQGGTICQDAKSLCTGYTLTNTASSNDKYIYCNSITTLEGKNCAFDPNSQNNCVNRSSCDLWKTESGIQCVNYLGTNTCSYSSTNNYCYQPGGSCDSYTVPNVADKITWCNTLSPLCSSDSSAKCVAISSCESLISPTSAIQCNTLLNTNNCQYYGSKCYTTATTCTLYLTTNIAENKRSEYCSSLKADDSGQVKLCKYNSNIPTTCTTITTFSLSQEPSECDQIVGATSADNCSFYESRIESYCTYYYGNCYGRNQCSSISVSAIAQDKRLNFCNAMLNYDPILCSYDGVSSYCKVSGSCDSISIVGVDPNVVCKQRNSSSILCKYDQAQTKCVETTGDERCSLITDATSDEDCAFKATVGLCIKVPGQSTCMVSQSSCSQYKQRGANSDEILLFCQGLQISGSYCTYISDISNCESAPTQCSGWSSLNSSVDNTIFCQNRISSNGSKCSYISGQSTCSDQGQTINSQADCDEYQAGKKYSNGTCYTQAADCNSYTATGNNNDEKLSYCNLLLNTGNQKCTFIHGTTTCINRGQCNSYSINLATLPDKNAKISACKAIETTDSQRCRYFGSGNTCLSFADCGAISGSTSQSDCDEFFSTCLYYNSKCYTFSSTCNYSTGGAGALAFCATMKNSTGDLCTAASDSAATCIERTCSDAAAANLTSNSACKIYKSTCKTDGTKCVDSSTACSTKTLDDCSTFLDTDNVSPCLASAGGSTSVTPCIDNTTLCTSYTGTKSVCMTYYGSAGKCNGDSDSVSGTCRNAYCSDLLTATKDSDCDIFLSGCLYNGAGCVDKSQPCSAYQGTIDTCKNFKGVEGTIPCWGASSATSGQCKDKECGDLLGTSDSACQVFLPAASGFPSNCITDGNKCVTYPRTCSQFTGTQDICSKLTATDGPCKSTSLTGSGTCTPRICTEAQITLITDAQCKIYHPTCVTTGRGCIQQGIGCGDVQTGNACNAKLGCTWATSCKVSPSTCSQLTANGQSACVNTPLASGTKCMWSSNNTCRDFLCTDYDVTITTHQKCQELNTSCTTSGAGCVIYGACSSYTSHFVCSAASTTEPLYKCAWDSNKCRQQICTDLKGVSNAECDQQLKGCKSNGSTCIGSTYSCSVFSGNKSFCITDSNSNPCIYLNDICYKFTSCQDIPFTDFENCQKASTNCVPSNSNCISITTCDKYDNQTSCIIGINNTTCGWLQQKSKCVTFGLCSDYEGTSLEDCKFYSSKCISDGSKCIDIGKCTSYLTSTSCSNAGTDGLCIYTNTCRLRQCSDLISTNDTNCSAFKVTTGICTTDGTKCVQRAKCNEYLSEAACTIGSDGIPCTFALPVGQTTGNKSCRARDCSEVTGATNDICLSAISGKICVSNGKSCLNQNTCSYYKNQISCNGGGTDGICAFIPSPTTNDTLAGTCQLFTSCEKANKDYVACKKNSAACYWNSTINGNETITSCSLQSCATKAMGTECFPIPNFDGSQYTICALQNNICTSADPSTLGSQICYTKSQYTYTWDSTSKTCVQCRSSTNSNSTVVNNTNSSGNSSTSYERTLTVLFQIIFLAAFD